MVWTLAMLMIHGNVLWWTIYISLYIIYIFILVDYFISVGLVQKWNDKERKINLAEVFLSPCFAE